ncbi:MAG: PEP-CTERM sorting domain-containing protein [Leptolyngbya sp. SIO4C1]|nr:PEP-CTERM sorting domain-containing protein [Leptolyngbya sp. SIO4C1]
MKHPIRLTLLAAAAATFGTVTVTVDAAQAATYQFRAMLSESIFLTGAPEIDLEPNPDFYRGTFSFDDSSLTGVGFESLGAEANLEVSLAEDPRVNQNIDPRFPEFPTVNFQDGELIGLDWFAVYHPFTNVPALDYPGDFVRISGTDLTDGFDPTFYTPPDEPRSPVLGFGTVQYSVVPEPGTILGLAAIALLGFRKFYQKKASSPTAGLN